MEFEGNIHVGISHNKMEFLKGRTYTLQNQHVMLNEKNLPYYFWAKVVTIVVYIMNQTPTTTVHGMTLEEKSQARN
jgi:hypothetical protein